VHLINQKIHTGLYKFTGKKSASCSVGVPFLSRETSAVKIFIIGLGAKANPAGHETPAS